MNKILDLISLAIKNKLIPVISKLVDLVLKIRNDWNRGKLEKKIKKENEEIKKVCDDGSLQDLINLGKAK